ncbi:flagellar hook-associated protein FlgK [Exilibacterium tricleocarpae]|uniref:Flagellar hook-associated protein 1 n=1 Tax=Exilibacterium tricleocarpae TaxID=2591008 RepID=A0A545U3T3_9GAMM|nr:flagellar hook-associated protein FlgK [Exilibacterium tricleocarpae]TQV84138.1 flagellar hook-associated protein FlgK [Exilibacterium tricleocarpae]
MASDFLGVSVTGLRISQQALRTSGHNIANADTPGFSRQRTLVTSAQGSFSGSGFIGNGANTVGIERITDQFVTDQLRLDTTLSSQLNAFNDNIRQLDTLLSDPATGLSEGLQSFFAALQNGTDDPTSIPARQLIVSEAQNLSNRFTTLYERLDTLNDGLNQQLSVAVTKVNALSSAIADLNRRISDAEGTGNNNLPNDLLDQRDEALRQLAELVNIQTFDEGGGKINVLVGSGQPLVIGNEARRIALVDGQQNTVNRDIAYRDPLGNQVITDLLDGGEIGGLIDFREQVLDPAFNDLGRIAIVLADAFNTQHRQGIDLNGSFGGPFFTDINGQNAALERVQGNGGNAPPADQVLSLEIVDAPVVSSSNYELSIEPGTNLFRVHRLSDGREVLSGLVPASLPATLEFEGMRLNLLAGTFQGGDRFLIQPTRYGARDIAAALVNPEDIAFGSPLLTDAAIGNTGSATISAGELLRLDDADGNPLPLFATPGEMRPPLLVRFTTATTYEVLDNTDPGKPVQLNPPIRNQQYIAGIENQLFSDDVGQTAIEANGVNLGLPAGRAAVRQASLNPAAPPAAAPAFGVTDFSAATNQFAFDVVVSNTLGGANDGTFTVTVNAPAIADNAALVAAINNDLTGTGVSAYIADNGTLALRLVTPGSGDITLQNYDNDPDGGANAAPAGQANSLLGFDIEGTSFTTVGDVDGLSGAGVAINGYPTEVVNITRTDPITGVTSTQSLVIPRNASAKQIANGLNNLTGVSANARNTIELSNLQVTRTAPLQLNLNGEDLLEYTVDSATLSPVLSTEVPDPAVDPVAFNDYVAERINANENLQTAGIYAISAVDSVTGRPQLRVFSTTGDDLQVALTAAAGETLDVSDGTGNPNVTLTGAGNSIESTIVVGGRLDVSLSDNFSFATLPPNSLIFGDSSAADFAVPAYLGIRAGISGTPQAGDTFTLDFNRDAALDNRNAIQLVGLEQAKTIGGVSSFADGYGKLVEEVGIRTNEVQINTEAAQQVLQQTTDLRNSISGVNLDEEAANLIRFEQIYAANARAISVARELFDRLINSF